MAILQGFSAFLGPETPSKWPDFEVICRFFLTMNWADLFCFIEEKHVLNPNLGHEPLLLDSLVQTKL